jgi:hypothetical protein
VQIFLILFLVLYFGITIFGLGNLNQRDLLESYFLLIFLAIFIGLPLIVGVFTRWDQQRKWNQLAEEMGLKIEQKSRFAFPTITGTHRGHRVSISQITQRRGRNRAYFTSFTIELIVSPRVNFAIQKRSLTHINRELTSDEEIDKRLTIKISSKRLLQQILQSSRIRQGLLELGERARTKNLVLQDKTLVYLENGQIRDTEYLRSVLVYLVELATLVERGEQIGY